MKYRKKPIVVEAVQWNGWSTELPMWALMAILFMPGQDEGDTAVYIRTLEGDMRAEVGDWLIRGVKGEVYPCKPDIFVMTYERRRRRVGDGGHGAMLKLRRGLLSDVG